MLQQQSLRGKWCISQRLSRHTSKLYSLFVHPVTAHVKERFLDLLGWRCIDVLLSILSFQGQPYDSCQVQVCFHPFLRAHKFLRWRNLDIIAQVTELWRGVFSIFHYLCMYIIYNCYRWRTFKRYRLIIGRDTKDLLLCIMHCNTVTNTFLFWHYILYYI